MNVSITVNGEQISREIEPRQLLIHFIRDTPGLTGTHWGCDTSNCGACVVQMDGEPVKSCTILAVMCEGHEIRTVEALEVDGQIGSDPDGLPRDACPPVRLLHAGDADDGPRLAGREPESHRAGDPHGDLGRNLPLHGLQEHRRRRSVGCRARSNRETGGLSMATVENLPSANDRAADRLRPAEAEGGRALHPRPGHVPRRHPASGDGPWRNAAQPVRARAHRLDRHLAGARASERRRRHHRQGPRDARARVDADDLLRHAGRARGRQGPLPGPGGRVRDRDGRVLGERRAPADRRRVRAAAGRRQRPQGARRRRAADPRRQDRASATTSRARPGRPATRRRRTAHSPRPTPS